MSKPVSQSPATISRNPEYEVVNDLMTGAWYPSADQCVVRHIATNTYWRCVYSVHEDDSDYDMIGNWYEGTIAKRTITEFVAKPIK